ncbi:unnamed protein product [Parajaminaea phylloscopi]
MNVFLLAVLILLFGTVDPIADATPLAAEGLPSATVAPNVVPVSSPLLNARFDVSSLRSSVSEMKASIHHSVDTMRSSIHESVSSLRSSLKNGASDEQPSRTSDAPAFMASVTASDTTTAFLPEATGDCKAIVDGRCCDTGVVINGKCYIVEGHSGTFVGDTDTKSGFSSSSSTDRTTRGTTNGVPVLAATSLRIKCKIAVILGSVNVLLAL